MPRGSRRSRSARIYARASSRCAHETKPGGGAMKRVSCLLLLVAVVTAVVAFMDSRVGGADEGAVPIYGIKLPSGYRDWTLISVAVVGGGQNDMRAKLGND